MNYLKLPVILGLIFLIACSPKTVLQTDTGEPIDLSGKWSRTDAEIAVNQVYEDLIQSEWLHTFSARNNYRPTILVNSFVNDFNDDVANQQIKEVFENVIEESRRFELIHSDDTSIPYFVLNGEINSSKFEMNNESGITYQLAIQLMNTEGEVVWNAEDTIKKFLKQ
ncbi:hypothetical protein JKA74_15235 [Marivirga sp. S37H4]|uniref:Penicillin-binding protein activator LpoB n=1 Tax=Marivirga aurantiaca TaxID=2802615 RepID=A0A935CAU6_9BACT|nr:hypothetical protein [Marivirga aurantiaca]MBK6266397.1 hypothetical protein [Marivirga aurantiaca]